MPVIVILIALIFVAMYVIMVYNGLVTAQIKTKEAWSTVETQLKRRYDLIPNLTETVRGYAKHEHKTLDAVVNARNMAMSLSGQSVQKEQYENMLSSALKSLFALSENYPDLKANTTFLQLQQEIADTENRIQGARSNYNTMVSDLNQKVKIFPNNIVATRFNIKEERFFELEETEREPVKLPPKVEF